MSEDKSILFWNLWHMLAVGYLEPEREYRFDKSIGRKHRFDFAWPDCHVAVEVNGNAWHTKGGGRHGNDNDLEKMNLAVLMGWKVLQFSPAMLEDDPVRWVDMVKNMIDNDIDRR